MTMTPNQVDYNFLLTKNLGMYTTLVSLKDKIITVPAVYLPFLKVVLADNESKIIAQTETSAVVNHFSDPKTKFIENH
jgi:hypothetical protein